MVEFVLGVVPGTTANDKMAPQTLSDRARVAPTMWWPLGAVSHHQHTTAVATPTELFTELVARDTALVKSRLKASGQKTMSGDEMASAERDRGIIGSPEEAAGSTNKRKRHREDDR